MLIMPRQILWPEVEMYAATMKDGVRLTLRQCSVRTEADCQTSLRTNANVFCSLVDYRVTIGAAVVYRLTRDRVDAALRP